MIDAAGNGHGIADHVLKTAWTLEVKDGGDTALDRLLDTCPFRCVQSAAAEACDGWGYELNHLRDAIKTINPILHQLLAVVIKEKGLNDNPGIHKTDIHSGCCATNGCR